MATQIKDTPVLYGKDAEAFHKVITENQYKKVPKAAYDRAQALYRCMRVVTQSNNEGSHADSRS